MTMQFRLALLVVAATIVFLVGCGQDLYPISGRVTYPDGSPVTHGRVVLDTPEPTGYWGLIYPDGKFELGSLTPNDGVPAGTYNAYLENTSTFPPAGSTADFTPSPLVHPKYADPKTSGLTLEVPATRHWEIVVEKP